MTFAEWLNSQPHDPYLRRERTDLEQHVKDLQCHHRDLDSVATFDDLKAWVGERHFIFNRPGRPDAIVVLWNEYRKAVGI